MLWRVFAGPMNKLLAALADEIETAATADRHRLQRQRRELKKRIEAGRPYDRLLGKLRKSVEASLQRVRERQQRLPEITFPEQLPIAAKREEISAAIGDHQVVVIAGETGSGKTTQIPKICLALGRGVRGIIGHTQPRRIAARTVASRIAEELKVPLGEAVGYQVRFTDHSNEYSHIKLMTDGILLAEIQTDPYLSRYDTLIIDEAHERSLNIDFLLGYLKLILVKRPDLKVIITSATIDVERFARHFDGVGTGLENPASEVTEPCRETKAMAKTPVIEVSGRTYPVEVLYRPQAPEQDDQFAAIVEAIGEIQHLERQRQAGRGGDILVFLSGEREIRETATAIRKADFPHLEVLPLYARLSLAEQNRVFQSHRGARVVLATNVAETSITVPGIRYVIDPGYARISRYSYRTKVQRLPIEVISQASANQRKGRCGRVSDGICIRLFDETDFNNRAEFTDAEIVRTNLAAVILQMLKLRIGDIRDFPFLDRPDRRLINDGFKLLQELQAVDPTGKLTAIGRQLTMLPTDPRLGRMLIAAGELGCVRELLIIASAISVQDPRERPPEKQQAADEKHRRFNDEHSDFLAYLKLWDYFENQRQELSQNQLRKLCQKEFLSYLRLREWRDTHYQLRLAVKALGIVENREPAGFESVHRALLSGLLGNIGFRGEEKEYLGARNRRFFIFPGSSQFKKLPKWIVAGQLLETSKLFAHTVARIDPLWVLAAASHLVKRHYFEPYYDSRGGRVMAFEKVSLYGLVLVEKQRVNYATIDPVVAREVFIRAALVEGRYGDNSRGKGTFFRHNQQVIAELHDLEAKSRRRDILTDDSVLYDFYAERIPEHIVNLSGFEAWRKEQEKTQPRLLFLQREWLMQHDASHITEAQFPNELVWEGMAFTLSYHFEPGHRDDGVSLHVPVSALHLVPELRLQWLVPGLLREKCIDLVKRLPKQWRKHFVPVPAFVDKALAGMNADNSALVERLGRQLQRHAGVEVPADVWREVEVEDYYRINIKVLDERGRCIDAGRDLAVLRQRYRDRLQRSLQSVDNSIERSGVTRWDFGTDETPVAGEHREELPSVVELDRDGIRIRAFPALVDETCSVAIRVLDEPARARYLSRRGVVRLLLLNLGPTVKSLRRELLKGKDIGLSVAGLGNRDKVIDDLLCAACAQVCFADTDTEALPRTGEQFDACLKVGQRQLTAVARELESLLANILTVLVQIKKALKAQKNALALAFTVADINVQLQWLLYPGCLYDTPPDWLRQYPRYLKAILVRLEKAPQNIQKDRLQITELESHWTRLEQRLEQEGGAALFTHLPLREYRWMLEEFRVSLFAQTLKTLMPVSGKRLDRQWELTL